MYGVMPYNINRRKAKTAGVANHLKGDITMNIKTETRSISIELRLWRDGWNAGYEPDCFNDVETNFRLDHQVDADHNVLCSDKDADELIAWWTDECACVNRDGDGDCLHLSAEERERGDEWTLFVE